MSARRGTGLGLSMVYELAKKLEAGLAVETALGKLPVGAGRAEMEQVRAETLAPFRVADEEARARTESARLQDDAARRADWYLTQVDSYVASMGQNLSGRHSDSKDLARILKQQIRPILIKEILEEPLTTLDAQTLIRGLIDRRLASIKRGAAPR